MRSELSRRTFLGSLGASAFPEALAVSSAPPPANLTRTRIYTVFFDTAPSPDDTDVRPITHEEIMLRLQRECPGADFTIRDLTRGATLPNVLNEVRAISPSQYDGVLIYGWGRDYDLFRTGLPTICIQIVNDFMHVPHPRYREFHVVDAALDPWRYSADPAVSERMFTDLVEKIKLIQALKRMRSEHILLVTDSPYVSVIYADALKEFPPERYNELLLGATHRTFGTRVTKIGTKEVTGDKTIRDLWYTDSKQANELADRWIRNAQKMTYTIPSEVVRSAKLYLAMKMLMKKYEATAIAFHIRTLIPNPRPEDMVFPALATSEFQLEHKVGKCQSHLPVVLSEMLLQYAYGRPSMLGDYGVDVYNGTSWVQHCEGPWNPWGDERRVPYILTDHRERRVRARNETGVGAASWVLYPAGEPVTMWQASVLNKELLLHTGTTINMLTGPVKYRDHLWEMM